jgi:hypothetical protein
MAGQRIIPLIITADGKQAVAEVRKIDDAFNKLDSDAVKSAQGASGQIRMTVEQARKEFGAGFDDMIKNSRGGVAEVAKATQAAGTTISAGVSASNSKIRKELGDTNLSFASTARSVSSLGRGIENVFTGNVLGALRNFGIFSRSALSPTGPLTYAKSLATVAEAQEGVTASTAATSAASSTSLGVYGLVAIAVGALAVGIYELVTAQRQVIIVSKSEIETTQQRVELSRQELDLAARMSAATDNERQKREALVVARKAELQTALELQKAQGLAIVTALTNALLNQETAAKRLRDAYEGNVGLTGGISDSILNIQSLNENLGKSQEETKKAAEAADILSAATGKSKEELFAAALVHAKLTDALGITQGAYIDLVHALGLVSDAQGHLIPATDAATIALRNQIGVLADLSAQAKKTKDDIDKINTARNTYIEGEVARIVQLSNGDSERAKRLLAEKLKSDPNFAYQVGQKRGDQAVEKTVNDRLFPSDKGAEKVLRDQRQQIEQQLRDIEDAYKHHVEDISRDYKLYLINLDEFTRRSVTEENERYQKIKSILEQEQALTKPNTAARAKVDRELATQARTHTQTLQKIADDSNQKEIDSLERHQQAQINLIEDYARRAEASYAYLAEAHKITFEKAEYEIYQAQAASFDAQLQALYDQQRRIYQAVGVVYDDAGNPISGLENAGKANVQALREVEDKISTLISKRASVEEESDRRMETARKKDLDNLRQYADEVRKLEENISETILDNRAATIDLLEKIGANPRYIRSQRDQYDRDAENLRNSERLAALETAKTELALSNRNLDQKNELREKYNRQVELEMQRHGIALTEIELRPLERFQAKVSEIANSIGDTFGNAFDALFEKGKTFWGSLESGFKQLFLGIVHDFIASRVRETIESLFRISPGGAQGGSGAASTGGLNLSNILGAIFGGIFGSKGGAQATPPFAGGSIPGISFSGLAGAGTAGFGFGLPSSATLFDTIAQLQGGGITAPTSLSSQAAQQSQLGALLGSSAQGGLGGLLKSGFSLSGLGTSLAPLLPFAGLGLGAGLGGGSGLSGILGGAGGLLAGGIGAALLAPGLFGVLPGAVTVAGSSSAAFAAGLYGFLTNPFTIAAAGALLVGAYLLSRKKQRDADEKTRTQLSGSVYDQTIQVLNALRAHKISGSEGLSQYQQIKNNYLTQAAQLKDSKTRRIAQDWLARDFAPFYDPLITAAAKDADEATKFSNKFNPEFAAGGLVPYRSMSTTLIKVRPGEMMIPPQHFGLGGIVPGIDRGYDSIYTYALPGTQILTKAQQSARGYASGGTVPGGPPAASTVQGGPLAPVTLNATFSMDAKGVVTGVLRSPEGRKITLNIVNDGIDKKEVRRN